MSIDIADDSPPDPGTEMSFRLVVLSGRDRGAVYRVPTDDELTMGRGEENDVVIHDAEVSREHCTLAAREGRFRLIDRGSTNGLIIDGDRLTEAELEPGARFRVGQTLFAVTCSEDTRAAVPAVGAAQPESEPVPAPAPVSESSNEVPSDLASPRTLPGRRLGRRLRLAALLLLLAASVAATAIVLQEQAEVAAEEAENVGRTVLLTTSPERAEVFLDDQFLGLAPLRFEVSDQLHALRVTRTGYQAWRARLEADVPDTLEVALEPEPSAALLITANQPDTQVYLNGRPVGRTRADEPLRIDRVPLGRCEVRFEKQGYLPHLEQLDIRRTSEEHLHGTLQSTQEAGLINVTRREPDNARAFTDLGHYYMITTEYDKAMDAYRRAWELVLSGEDTGSYAQRLRQEMMKLIYRGVFQYGDPEDVPEVRDRVEDMLLDLESDHRRARAELMRIIVQYQRRNETNDLIRVYGKMVERETNNWQHHHNLGQAYLTRAKAQRSRQDRRSAIEHLETALEHVRSGSHRENVQQHLEEAQNLELDE